MGEENKTESFVEKYFKDEGRAEGRNEMLNAAASFMREKGFSPEVISEFKSSLSRGLGGSC